MLFDVLDNEGRHAMVVNAGKSGEVIDDIFVIVPQLLETELKEVPELGDIVADGRWWSWQTLHLWDIGVRGCTRVLLGLKMR